MSPLAATDNPETDRVDLMPRWLRSAIAAAALPQPSLPFQRSLRRHPGSLPVPALRPVAIAAR